MMGYKAIYNPLASVYHRVPKSRMQVEYFCRRAYNQGISDSYTHIRRAEGLTREVISKWRQPGQFERFSNLYSRVRKKTPVQIPSAIWRRVVRLGRRIIHRTTQNDLVPQSSSLASIREQISIAYRAGYAFHQEEVRNDPELLNWVLKPAYWDCRLPEVFAPTMVHERLERRRV
jgi:hypothetical protein